MLTTPETLSESASLSSSGIVSYLCSKSGLCGAWKSADCRRKGHSMDFETKQLGHAPDAIAPDGCEVRVLGRVGRASMAHFTLPPKAVSKAVAHHTIEE